MWDEAEYERWSASAEDALAAARDNADRGWHNWACMIAEQAAQLAVKAVIHAVGRGAAARGHDLVALLDRVAEETGTAADDVVAGAALRLSRHYQPTTTLTRCRAARRTGATGSTTLRKRLPTAPPCSPTRVGSTTR